MEMAGPSLSGFYDGNVPFLQGKHKALFLMALAVTLLFILPFTLLLLLAPCIQASNHFIVQWVKMIEVGEVGET